MVKEAVCVSGYKTNDVRTRTDNIARNLFSPENKNPYYFNGKELKNIDDLKQNLQNFTDTDAMWVAEWIKYLGDPYTAEQIRSRPKDFKKIINARHKELLEHHCH
jgi:hypothetical protein